MQALTKKLKGPVLCFVGPPGVGKTSLAKSIARATGRKFVRLSLGGVRDEAEIRGHRRTYIGAMPGKLIQSLKKAGTNNPVFLLDEVDKMSTDFRGDPAAALLEVLDPEQNHAFNDHYLDLDYDLSDVMFITTANTLGGIPVPLQDRMEIIQLSGYTEFEKLNIAVKYLVPRQRKECGLEDVPLTITESALRTVIHHYTKEAGVRSLEREIASICRKVARQVVGRAARTTAPIEVVAQGRAAVPRRAEVPRRQEGRARRDRPHQRPRRSRRTAAASCSRARSRSSPGKGKLVITGLLEKGMEESAQAAMSYVRVARERARARAGLLPEGRRARALPRVRPEGRAERGRDDGDGLASALIKVPVQRDLAMTGEITLRGRVMPIGGLKEKLLAAHRSGITTVIVPQENRKDLREVPRRVLKATRIVLVEHMDEVLREALCLPDARRALRRAPKERWEYREGELVVIPGGSGPVGVGLGVPGAGVGPGKGPPPEPAAPLPA